MSKVKEQLNKMFKLLIEDCESRGEACIIFGYHRTKGFDDDDSIYTMAKSTSVRDIDSALFKGYVDSEFRIE